MRRHRGGHEGTILDGVFFTEEPDQSAWVSSRPLTVRINRQNASLRQVKTRLASQVVAAGGNSLVSFTYGQRTHSPFRKLLPWVWDTESWYGSGYAACLPDFDQIA